MNANWKQRYNQMEDTRVGREMDYYIELGIMFSMVALHNEYGFGEKRITHLRRTIQRYVDREFNGGTAKFSSERRLNVERGLERLGEAYRQIFNKQKGQKHHAENAHDSEKRNEDLLSL